jgi:hypothetical protein
MRRHTATAAFAAILLAALTACGSSRETTGKTATAPTSTPAPSTSAEREGQFIFDSQGINFTTRRPSNEELLIYPPKWCAALDQGHSVEWMFTMFGGGGGLYPIGDDWGTKKADADALLVAGVKTYCPENLDAVTSELRASGEY